MPAYYATPGEGKRPAVIVLQEIFGINTEMRRITDLLAGAGYAAVAINYYYRTDPGLNVPYNQDGMKTGMAAASHLSRANLRTDIEAAIAWLREQPGVDGERIGAWGFCMGGSVAFLAATMPGIRAAAAFYGGSIAAPFASGEPEALQDAAAVKAPLLLVYGGKDQHITAEHRERTKKTLERENISFDMKVYENEDHGFFRQSSQAFDNADVTDAWERVQRFFACL